MAEPAEITQGLANCLKALRSALVKHVRLIDLLIGVTIRKVTVPEGARPVSISGSLAQAIPIMLQSLGASSYTVLQLSSTTGLQTKDCFSVARSIVELAVNVCYIFGEGEPAADRALRHARQKSYRDMARESKVAGHAIRVSYPGSTRAAAVPGLEDDFREFTARGGHEKAWVDLSIDDRIAQVGQTFGGGVLGSLHMARFMIYRHSSEVLHGTLFGALYFMGVTSPPRAPRNPAELAEFLGQQQMVALVAVNKALSVVVECFHRKYGLESAFSRSAAIMKELGALPYLSETPQADEAE